MRSFSSFDFNRQEGIFSEASTSRFLHQHQRVFSLSRLEGRGSFSCFQIFGFQLQHQRVFSLFYNRNEEDFLLSFWLEERGSFSYFLTSIPEGFSLDPQQERRGCSLSSRLEGRGSFSPFLTSIPEGFFSGSTTGTERIRPVFRLEGRGSFSHFLISTPEGFSPVLPQERRGYPFVFDCQLINSKFRDLAVKIPSSTLAISRTFPTGLLLLRMISTNQ